MITIVAKLKVKLGNEEAMKEAMKEAASKVRAIESGNLAYIPHQSQADPTIFLFYEKYKDQAALDFHRKKDRGNPRWKTRDRFLQRDSLKGHIDLIINIHNCLEAGYLESFISECQIPEHR